MKILPKSDNLKKVCFRITIEQNDHLHKLAKHSSVPYAVLIRGLLTENIIHYFMESGCFICDVCRAVCKLSAQRDIYIDEKLYHVGNCCFESYLQHHDSFVCQSCKVFRHTKTKRYVHTNGETLQVGDCCVRKEEFKVFICQSCGIERNSKKMHIIVMGNDEFKFGDCCYFNDSYKEIVRRFI
jgi:predicted DNA-binding protein